MKRNTLFSVYTGTILVLVTLSSCYNNKKKNSEQIQEKELTQLITQNKGFQLLNNSCFICHHPDPAIVNRIAPGMAEVKQQYLKEGESKEKFMGLIKSFTANPTPHTAKMPDAVKKYGLMPRMNFSEADLDLIAAYIFETDIEGTDWYEKFYLAEIQKPQAVDSSLSYEAMGLNFALATKAVLGKNLMTAIKTQGVENAITFCNTRAYFITDSMGMALGAKIKRVSGNNRNKNNLANTAEQAYINESKQKLVKGEKIKPRLIDNDGIITAYYPILTENTCLKCHGVLNKDVTAKTQDRIKHLYPGDKATGYKENELRGIWVIEMNRK